MCQKAEPNEPIDLRFPIRVGQIKCVAHSTQNDALIQRVFLPTIKIVGTLKNAK